MTRLWLWAEEEKSSPFLVKERKENKRGEWENVRRRGKAIEGKTWRNFETISDIVTQKLIESIYFVVKVRPIIQAERQ